MALGWLGSLQSLETIEVGVLVVPKLLGYDVIKLLGGIHIMCMGVIRFQEAASVCVMLKIDQAGPCFLVLIKFDTDQKAWTTSWKGMEDKEPPKLQNCMVEYRMPDCFRLAYEQVEKTLMRV